MAQIATVEFLTHLQTLFTDGKRPTVERRWYILAAVAFSASNLPEAVPLIFQYTLEQLKREGVGKDDNMHKDQLSLARRMRECVFRAGMLNGYGRAINSLVALHEVMPNNLQDTEVLRDTEKTMQEYADDGRRLFRAMYAGNANDVQGLLNEIHPDMGWFSNTIAYGVVYGGSDVLSQVEVSFVMATANIVMDTPKQAGWHLKNALNSGATLQEVEGVRIIATEIASRADTVWKSIAAEIK